MDNQLLNLSQGFDRATIIAIENAYIKSLVKFTPQDTDAILILFKQAVGLGNASNLSNNIVALSNSGIVPSAYSIYGIVGTNGVSSAVIALSRGISAPVMKRLGDLGIKTTDYERLGIKSKEIAEGVSNVVNLGKDELVVADKSFLDANGRIDWDKYAPNGGYVSGTKVDGVTLDVGQIIDRYGNPRGRYTSPVGVPYEQRALPYIENPNAYHKYEIIKPIKNVNIGKIAPAFNQPGGGVQYELPNSIEYLIDEGYLKEIK